MTTLNIAQIPNSITTLEELAAWCGYALRECAPNQAFVEAIGVTNFRADMNEAVSPDGTPFLIIRFVLDVAPPSAFTGKPWNAVKEIPRSADIPTFYLSN